MAKYEEMKKVYDDYEWIERDTKSLLCYPNNNKIISIITPYCTYHADLKYWTCMAPRSIILNDRLIDDQAFKDKVWTCFKPIHAFLEENDWDLLGACLRFSEIQSYFGYIDHEKPTSITFATFRKKETKGVFRYMLEG